MKILKTIGKSFVVAFSIYSKIPMPRFVWESEDMRYHLCFFPWVGAVIGGAEYLWYWICDRYGLGTFFFVALAMAIPVLITGGFHLDGFMDTCDGLHSYQDREKKLEILKDPHIGAFAVICLAVYLILGAGFLGELYERISGPGEIALLCMSFFLSRCLSGISVVTMRGAKEKGMLQTFSETAGKKKVGLILGIQLVLCALVMLLMCWYQGLAVIGAVLCAYLYYWYKSKKEFGGITGDLAGYFVSLSELMALIAFTVTQI